MTLLWIGDAILIVVVLPVVVYLLNMTLGAARSIVPSVRSIAAPPPCSSPPVTRYPARWRASPSTAAPWT
jgi:hypothetical protein